MAEPEIRPFRPEDADGVIALHRNVLPEEVLTKRHLLHWLESQPERAGMRAWVAIADGDVVGWSEGHLRWSIEATDVGWLWVGVRTERRGQKLGGRLYAVAEDHVRSLRARRAESTVRESDEHARGFAQRRGFVEGRRERYSAVALRGTASASSEPPEGFDVVPLRDLRDRERDLFELYDAAHRDMPGDHQHVLEFEEWRRETLENPELDLELSAVVLAGDRPVSMAWITSDREGRRGEHEMTGTAPEFRRRGLARLAKEAAIRWAAEAGLETLVTSNDAVNADMLALNEHLGYRPTYIKIALAKEF